MHNQRSSQIDYRPILDRQTSHGSGRRSLHWLLLFGFIAIGTLLLSLTPEPAEATRSENLTTDLPSTANYIPIEITVTPALQAPLHEIKTATKAKITTTTKHYTIRAGDNLSSIFTRQGLDQQLMLEVLKPRKARSGLKRIHPGDTLIFTLDENQQLQKLVLQKDPLNALHIERQGDSFQAKHIQREPERRLQHANATVEDSLFLSAQRAGLSDKITMELAAIFGWDIDFALDIRKGDHFNLLYEELYLDGENIGTGNIVAAEFTNQKRHYQAIHYTDPKGVSNYFTPKGTSMRKAFLRTPIPLARISSRFNLKRRHPVLNKIRAHKGVDYAAMTGTPIKSTGDGKIIHRGRKGGYGNTIIIQHGTRYSTLYAHMSRFKAKLKVGSRVKQGQTIGYVGSTGLATGPHLHYEFRVNNHHRNPLTVKLPAANPINKKYLADFKSKTQDLLTQLNLFQRSQVATIN